MVLLMSNKLVTGKRRTSINRPLASAVYLVSSCSRKHRCESQSLNHILSLGDFSFPYESRIPTPCLKYPTILNPPIRQRKLERKYAPFAQQ